jgi:uncharacterized membrane-anchored protein YitT (DUF2179 family)
LNWQRLAAARTILLVLLGFLSVAAGVAMFCVPAGVITFGVLAVALAYLTDVGTGQPVRR